MSREVILVPCLSAFAASFSKRRHVESQIVQRSFPSDSHYQDTRRVDAGVIPFILSDRC